MPVNPETLGGSKKKRRKKPKYHPPKGVGGAIGGAGSTAVKSSGGKKGHKSKPSKSTQQAVAQAFQAAGKGGKQASSKLSTPKTTTGYYTKALGKTTKSIAKIPTLPDGMSVADYQNLSKTDKTQLRKVNELNRDYKNSSTVSKLLLPPAGVNAGDAPIIGGIGEGKGIINAIKSIVTSKGESAAVKAAAKAGTAKGLPKAAREGGAVPAKGEEAAAKLRTAISRSAKGSKASRAGKAVKGAPKAAAGKVKSGARTATHPQEWEVASKAGRSAKYRRLNSKGAWLVGSAGGSAVAGGGALVGNTVDATFENGKINTQPLKTTVRALKATPSALATDAGAIVTGHPEKVVDETKAMFDAYGKLMGNPEEAKKVINEDLGYVPLITGALGLLRTKGTIAPAEDAKLPLRVRAALKAKRIDPADATEGIVQGIKDKSRVAQLASHVDPRAKGSMAHNVRDISGRVKNNLGKLHRRKVADVHVGVDTEGKPIVRTVRGDDLVAFIADTGTPLSASKGPAFIRDHVLPSIDRSRRPVTTEFTPSNIADAILKNPSVLDDPALRRAVDGLRKAQGTVDARRHALDTQGHDIPEAASGAADVTQSRMFGVPTREEATPPRARDFTNAKGEPLIQPRAGHSAEKVIKGKAKSLENRAKRLEAQATALHRTHPERADVLTERAAKYKAQAQALRGSINFMDKAAQMDRLASRITRGQGRLPKEYRDLNPDELRAAAEKLRSNAEGLRQQHLAESRQIEGEIAAALDKAREATGAEKPIFVKAQNAEDAISVQGSRDVPWTAGAGNAQAKLREGKLWQGDSSMMGGDRLMQGLFRTEIALSRQTYHREFFNEFLHRDESGQVSFLTDSEIKDLKKQGTYPPGYVAVPIHEINGPFQAGRWNEAAGLIDSPIHAGLREARGLEGKKYGLVPKAAWDEFKGQSEKLNGLLNGVAKATRGSAIALLGYNPVWFLVQLPASPLAMWASHPNVARWVKAAVDVHRAHKDLGNREWENYQAKYGATSSAQFDIHAMDNVGINPNELRFYEKAAKIARTTWGGKVLRVLKEGPAVVGNRKFEGYIRDIDAMLEMDNMVATSRRPLVHRYAHNVADLHESVWAQIQKMKPMTPAERVKFVNSEDGQFAARELTRKINDSVGDWSSMTHAERQAAAVLMFYPFLRFSLRWTFYAFPKNRPITAALALNAAQANAMEVDDRTREGGKHGGPSSEMAYGQIPITDNFGLDLNRMNPASNAITDIVSGDRKPLQAVTAPFTPALGIGISALQGVDPYTGEPVDKSGWQIAGEGAANLLPAARPFLDKHSEFSTLLRVIRGQPTSAPGKALIPQIAYDPTREAEAQRVQGLYDKAFGDILDPKTGDPLHKADIREYWDPKQRLKLIQAYNDRVKAQREIGALFDKYGIKPPYEMGSAPFIDFPAGGTNKTTKEPPRRVYIDPKKKRRWENSGKASGSSSTGYEQYMQDTTSNSYEQYMPKESTKSYDQYLTK